MRKRLVDLLFGVPLGILAVPLVLIMAIVSAVLFRAWPFFRQARVGLDGRSFRILKIRTLPPTAPSQAHKFAIEEIPLPRFASLLRNSHLDELPQLWLVPLGSMSLVGPRPEMFFLHEQGDSEFGNLRVSVRPGCTGLWQVSKAAAGLIWDTTEYDRFYIQHRCLRLDAWILARTLLIMTPLAQTISLADVPRWALSKRSRAILSGDVRVPTQGDEAQLESAPAVIDLTDDAAKEPVVLDLRAAPDLSTS